VIIDILCVGRTLRSDERVWMDDYFHRIQSFAPCSIRRIKEASGSTPAQRADATWQEIQKQIPKQSYSILLDPNGDRVTTEAFATLFDQAQKSARNRVVFLVGGSYGFPSDAPSSVDRTISLSPLTLPHRLALLLLIEQIYRVLSWRAGSPYHHP